jgi:acetylornithine/succinyldiaminopimelate/putrescine aminotransferase
MDTAKTETLVAEALANDVRILQAKKLLLDAVKDHQKNLTKIRPAHQNRQLHYKELITAFDNCRGGKLWFPYIGSGIGHGALVELLDGSVKYDFINGIGPHYWGHSHPDIIEANIDAALSDVVMQGNLQQNADALEFTELLVKHSKMDFCFLSSSGAIANENAIKLLFQNKAPANRILAFERCFMGRTWALSQITDRPLYREGLPSNILVDYIPFFDSENPEKSTEKAVEVLKKCVTRYPKEYAFMCFEMIQGDGGFYPGSTKFFETLIAILKENDIRVFVDEIQTFGRTSELFAFQYYGLQNSVDVVSIGKLSQVCATLFTKHIKPRPGLLSQTFTSSTSAIKAGKVIVSGLLENDFFGPQGKIQQISSFFVQKLQQLADRHPLLIKGPFGAGAMIAFTPFDGSYQRSNQLVMDLFDAGVMSFIVGTNPTRVRFLPPIGVVTFEDIDNVVNILEKVLAKEAL